ncbi:MAG: hypothetical protein U0R18_04360 [Mycobacterium sp.]
MRLGLPGDDEDDDLDDDVVPAPEGVAVTTRYHPLMFGYALCTPNILVDGCPVPVVGWGRVIIPAAPGEHHIQVDIPLFGTRRVGAAECTATVTAGTFTELGYRAPRGGSAPGWVGPRNSG